MPEYFIRKDPTMNHFNRKVPTKPEVSTKEYLKWKAGREQDFMTSRNKELENIMREQWSELEAYKASDQAKVVASLKSELSAYKSETMRLQKKCDSAFDLAMELRNKLANAKKKILLFEFEKKKKKEEMEKKASSQLTNQANEFNEKISEQDQVYSSSMKKLEDNIKRLKSDSVLKLMEKSEELEKISETFTKLIDEKDEKIAELSKRIKELEKPPGEKELLEKEQEKKNESLEKDVWALKKKIDELNVEIQKDNEKIVSLDKEGKKLNEEKNDEMSRFIREKKEMHKQREELRKQLKETEAKCTLLEAKLQRTNAILKISEEENDYMKDQLKLSDIKTRTLKDRNENLHCRQKTLKQNLIAEKERYKALEHKWHDIVVNLQDCKSVLEEPRSLKAKVTAMIGHFDHGHNKLKVEQDVENANKLLSQLLKDKIERSERIEILHQREKKQMYDNMWNTKKEFIFYYNTNKLKQEAAKKASQQRPVKSTVNNTAPVNTESITTATIKTAPVKTAPVNTATVKTAPVKTATVKTATKKPRFR
ncbi:uncharacterized protein [Eucyclogobius newberryi]|uniref:uncharacterized protein n=1 Tax=Eucyclogobius newberryi TaxID=166745 RepID=UPI003B5C0055